MPRDDDELVHVSSMIQIFIERTIFVDVCCIRHLVFLQWNVKCSKGLSPDSGIQGESKAVAAEEIFITGNERSDLE